MCSYCGVVYSLVGVAIVNWWVWLLWAWWVWLPVQLAIEVAGLHVGMW